MPETFRSFLAPTPRIDSDHPSIRLLAINLTEGATNVCENAVRLFRFVRDAVRYNPYAPLMDEADYVASTILERGEGYCVQKAILLCALARAAEIPCRLKFADIRSHIVPAELARMMGTDLFTYHGYVEMALGNRWLAAVPAFDRATCERQGYRLVEFDGRSDAVLPATDLSGRPHFEYVREIGTYADVPYDEIIEAFRRVYAGALTRPDAKS